MNLENIPLWPIISVLAGIVYFCWLVFAKDQDVFLKAGAFFKSLHLWFANFFVKTQFSEETAPVSEINLRSWRTWAEWVLIALPVWVYCLPFLDLGTLRNLPGLESEYFQAFDQVLEFSIKNHGQFPLWNPYFHTGVPYIAHPMLHAYNPFITIPVLLFGVLDGFKLAVFFGFLIAGFGMWWLGREVGLGAVVRVWVALMFVFSGVPAAKFIQGHYLLVLAFGWIPFSLAAILAAIRSKRRVYISLAALSLGLLFFCGNAYYAYYMLYVLTIFIVVILFTGINHPVFLRIDWGKIKILLAILCLTLGLIAIQLLPLLEYRDHFIKAVNMNLSDSQDVPTILQNFLSPEPFRPGIYSYVLRPEEFYAYVGWWPFLALLLLPLGWNQKSRRFIVFFVVLIVFTFIWIDVKDMPWRELFQTNPILLQFRYPSRMLVVGTMALIMAGGLGLNALLPRYSQGASLLEAGDPSALTRHRLGLLVLGIFMFWAVYDLAATSRHLLGTVNNDQSQAQQAISLLKESDSEIYYVNGTWAGIRRLLGQRCVFKIYGMQLLSHLISKVKLAKGEYRHNRNICCWRMMKLFQKMQPY